MYLLWNQGIRTIRVVLYICEPYKQDALYCNSDEPVCGMATRHSFAE